MLAEIVMYLVHSLFLNWLLSFVCEGDFCLTFSDFLRVARGPDYKIIMMVNSPDGGKGSR